MIPLSACSHLLNYHKWKKSPLFYSKQWKGLHFSFCSKPEHSCFQSRLWNSPHVSSEKGCVTQRWLWAIGSHSQLMELWQSSSRDPICFLKQILSMFSTCLNVLIEDIKKALLLLWYQTQVPSGTLPLLWNQARVGSASSPISLN